MTSQEEWRYCRSFALDQWFQPAGLDGNLTLSTARIPVSNAGGIHVRKLLPADNLGTRHFV
jgi:hypothetical protein